ncbi:MULTISPECIES: SOS response-associated peptidase family protein [Halomonas]|uniref:SOS response associated peptidase (SRAP) n=1 Tax=Halomonas ventosae TaxID=229007 RepID=A0A4R6HNL5_9GAMM|nr:SOS response-associated peptidase family protein [Halomonas ventosae]TDO09901.1 SOS response associated peptidase (SRAP) [Halomonas ventosae]
MCGRFALYSDFPTLAASLKLPLAEGELTPRYNVAPGTWIPAVRRRDEDSSHCQTSWCFNGSRL